MAQCAATALALLLLAALPKVASLPFEDDYEILVDMPEIGEEEEFFLESRAAPMVVARRSNTTGSSMEGAYTDIFMHPGSVGKVLSLDKLMDGTVQSDWMSLGVAVVFLVIFDALVLSRFCPDGRLPSDVERPLMELFSSCDAAGRGRACHRDLLAALRRHEEFRNLCGEDGAKMEKLARQPENEFSWKEFEAFYLQHASSHTGSMRHMRAHWCILFIWLLMGAMFNFWIYRVKGPEAGMQWCAGYLLEWLLSMDNLFVFHLIFRSYATPRALLHKALFLGIFGAAICRMWFFAILSELLHLFSWVRAIFGILLIYSGIQAAQGDDDDDEEVADNCVVRLLRSMFGSRILDQYDLENHGLFLWKDGRLAMTLLGPVVLCLEVTDILFALDSVSAKVAQIPNYYIAYSSSVLAIFGLRSLFFIIQDLVDCFSLLKYGLCFILVFIGIELMAAPWVELPASAVVAVICAVFVICIAGSAAASREAKHEDDQDGKPEKAG